ASRRLDYPRRPPEAGRARRRTRHLAGSCARLHQHGHPARRARPRPDDDLDQRDPRPRPLTPLPEGLPMSFTIHHLPAARSPAPASGPPPGRPPGQEAAVIGALPASTFVVVLSETTMGVAIPPLMRELDVPAASAQWLTTGFMLTMAIVIPVTGFLLRRFPM